MTFQLNEEQKEAVFYDGLKPLFIEAGAGSGKTRVMTERVRYLLERGENPESILVCTFSNKAARELKDRLIEFASDEDSQIKISDINKMQISTIHSFCLSLIKQRGYHYEFIDDEYSEKRDMFIYKHLKNLGFTGLAHARRSDVKNIANKFNEFLTFKVKEDELKEYLEINFPIKENYIEFIEKCEEEISPINLIYKDKELKESCEGYYDSWYNAKYLQIVKAFPIYKQLLKENKVTDFSYVQTLALSLLEENNKTPYKNILVDEFQDTDPIQAQIFEILLKEALKYNSPDNIKGTFTAVGDMNQNIYGFRGALYNYFEEFDKKLDCEFKSINVNHRSSNQIIELSEDFIKDHRKDYSTQKIRPFKNLNRDCYYLKSENQVNEASNLRKIIQNLVKNKKAEYKDILILFRSVEYNSKELVEEFESCEIPYHVRGKTTLEDRDEIKSILTLLYYFNQIPSEIPITLKWDWLNLRAFTGRNFNPIWNLSDETKEILNQIQDNYEEKVLEVGKIVQKEMGASTKRTFKGMFNHDEEVLAEIFKQVQEPVLSYKLLKENNVENVEDLEFFNKLFKLKDEFFNKKFEEREPILEIYYKLIDLTGYLNEEFVNDPQNEDIITNIGILTKTITNYEDIISKSDIRGLFWYLHTNLKNYKTPSINEEGVQIMTVHEAKGLEYPITILASLREGSFPKAYQDRQEAGRFKEPYFTPNEFLEYRISQNEEEAKHNIEEENIIYVAMTRAEDTLIFSISGKESRNKVAVDIEKATPLKIQELIDKNPDKLKELDIDNLEVIEKLNSSKEKESDKKLNLSFSSLDQYSSCPFEYNLRQNFGFELSSNEYLDLGKVIHESIDTINKLLKEGESITKEEIILTVCKFHDNYFNVVDPFKKQRAIDNVLYYFDNYGFNFKVLDSEYEFNISTNEYTLTGAIDLILEENDGSISIIDYKNSQKITNYKKEVYKKQILTYILALKDDPKYMEKEVSKAYIYATQGREMIPIDLGDSKKDNREKEIHNISKEIKSAKYNKRVKNNCEWCGFNFICLENRCEECGKPILDNQEICRDCEEIVKKI